MDTCVYLLAVMNNAAVNICVQVFLWTYVSIFLEYIPRSRISGSCGNSMPDCFPKYCKKLHYFTFPPAVYEGSNFSIFSPTFVIMYFLLDLYHFQSTWAGILIKFIFISFFFLDLPPSHWFPWPFHIWGQLNYWLSISWLVQVGFVCEIMFLSGIV